MKIIDFTGIECIEAGFGEINLLVSRSVGPRILSFSYRDSGNIFAELPGLSVEHPEKGKYFFYGGHRLWVAPEIPSITYIPDSRPIAINAEPQAIELADKEANEAGIRKSIRIQGTEYPNILIVDHKLQNEGNDTLNIAPWAITQFKLGGKAILPFKAVGHESNPYLPDRSLSLWPYTDIQDARIHYNQDFIILTPSPEKEAPVKLGVFHFQQWLGYFINGYLFIKYSDKGAPDCRLDLGAMGQCYCNDKFLELETLGKYSKIEPGMGISHKEVWRIVEKPFDDPSSETILNFLESDDKAEYCQRLLK
jgi:hypothetical protein